MSRKIAWLAPLLVLNVVCSSPLQAEDFLENLEKNLEKNFYLTGPRYNRVIPTCEYRQALDRIIADFHTKEIRFWNSALQIVGIEDIRQTAILPWAAQSIPRRFCSGTALINDGARRAIYYSIGEDEGPIGIGFGITFCVNGLDRDMEYGPGCRAAKP